MLSVNRQIWDVYTDGLVPIACSEPITTPHEVKEHGKKGERKQSTFYPNTDSGDIKQKHIYLRDQTWVSCIAGRLFTVWAIREALKIYRYTLITGEMTIYWRATTWWAFCLEFLIYIIQLHREK